MSGPPLCFLVLHVLTTSARPPDSDRQTRFFPPRTRLSTWLFHLSEFMDRLTISSGLDGFTVHMEGPAIPRLPSANSSSRPETLDSRLLSHNLSQKRFSLYVRKSQSSGDSLSHLFIKQFLRAFVFTAMFLTQRGPDAQNQRVEWVQSTPPQLWTRHQRWHISDANPDSLMKKKKNTKTLAKGSAQAPLTTPWLP